MTTPGTSFGRNMNPAGLIGWLQGPERPGHSFPRPTFTSIGRQAHLVTRLSQPILLSLTRKYKIAFKEKKETKELFIDKLFSILSSAISNHLIFNEISFSSFFPRINYYLNKNKGKVETF